MYFADIFTEVSQARFKPSQIPSIKRWINLREAQIWAAADWPWKLTGPSPLPVLQGQSTPVLPAELGTPLEVYDAGGSPLRYLVQDDFDALYASGPSGSPQDWKWARRQLTLGPRPERDASFQISYYRDVCHLRTPVFDPNARGDPRQAGQLVPGPMRLDDDFPVFDVEWHELLTIGAIATGLKVENDPTWVSLESEFKLMLLVMTDHYLPSLSVAGNLQYGADSL
jgi:hypothetical protein